MKSKNKRIFNIKLYIIIPLLIFEDSLLVACSNYISMKLMNYNNEQIKNTPDSSFMPENFINSKIDNIIYTELNIGQPPQKLIAIIDAEEYSYFLFKDTCLINSHFDEKESSTFEPNYSETFFYNGYGKAIYINETFLLNNDIYDSNQNIKLKNFPIIFMNDPKNDEFFMQRHSPEEISGKTCVTIGIRYTKDYLNTISKNFLFVLKEKDIIDDYILFFEYDEKGNEKNLILGGYPEEIYKNLNKFLVNNQKTTPIKIYNRFKPQWGFQCDKVFSGQEKINKEDIAFHYNLGVIYGPKDYQEHIENTFFSNYFRSKICNKKINEKFTIFYCGRDKFNIDERKKFPELVFFKNDLEEKFNLTYQDLFFTKGDNVYFLIVFNHIYDDIWELGKPFLKKYSFAFNFDSKIIWYYKDLNGKTKALQNEMNQKTDKKKFIFIILFLSLFLGVICFLFGKILYNKKVKKLIKAKELEQNFSYINNKEDKIENKLIE